MSDTNTFKAVRVVLLRLTRNSPSVGGIYVEESLLVESDDIVASEIMNGINFIF